MQDALRARRVDDVIRRGDVHKQNVLRARRPRAGQDDPLHCTRQEQDRTTLLYCNNTQAKLESGLGSTSLGLPSHHLHVPPCLCVTTIQLIRAF